MSNLRSSWQSSAEGAKNRFGVVAGWLETATLSGSRHTRAGRSTTA
ncbi:hypothetical protein DVS28_a1361 [Euzebya pacifica]|uniref:Uncharacterized protein n=1 Tax=Euzebya pacifica TaxID=1608957 RepID=A0A346XV13_9ACTN|nr:hypothetical protein DVS28_a1361 [Euzebya pacifica]